MPSFPPIFQRPAEHIRNNRREIPVIWDLQSIRQRVMLSGVVYLSKPELYLMFGDTDGTATVLAEKVSDALQYELEQAGLQVFKQGGEWYACGKEQ